MLVYHSDSCVGWCTVDLVSIFAVVVVVVVIVVIVVWSAAVLCAVEIVLFGLHTETLMGCLCAIDMSLSTTLEGVMCLYSCWSVCTILTDLVCVFYVTVVVVVVTTCSLTLILSIIV